MTSRRIEPQRLDVILETLKPPAREAPDARGLDIRGSNLRTTGVRGADGAESTDFEALLQSAVGLQPGRPAPRLLREEMIDFVIPRIGDPTVLRGDHSISILEYLISSVLPTLPGSEEVRAAASAVLADEIGRHRELISRVHRGIAA